MEPIKVRKPRLMEFLFWVSYGYGLWVQNPPSCPVFHPAIQNATGALVWFWLPRYLLIDDEKRIAACVDPAEAKWPKNHGKETQKS